MGVQTFEKQTNEGMILGMPDFRIQETTRKAYKDGQAHYSSQNIQLHSNVNLQHIPLPGNLKEYLDNHLYNAENNME